MRTLLLACLLSFALGLVSTAYAKPPPWAPAHGWRNKNNGEARERYYVGYSGSQYARDFGIEQGSCNREEIGSVIGGVVGGVVGNRVADREDRVVATILGTAVGALIGAKVGRDLDARDRGCLGHALELGASGKKVSWTNDETGVLYELVPGSGDRRNGVVCRNFVLNSIIDGRRYSRRATACQKQSHVWELKSR